MAQIRFTVYGDPTPKARPRFSLTRGFVQVFTAEKTKAYENEVAMMSKAAMAGRQPFEGALAVSIVQTFAVPATYGKKRTEECLTGLIQHTKRPDADNVMKCVIDGMGKAKTVFLNDSQCVWLFTMKEYGWVAKVEVIVAEAQKNPFMLTLSD
jgi:Holliday junction resolvase RusA-like endonuclease